MSTKAQTLRFIKNKLTDAKILDQFSFNVCQWNLDRANILSKVNFDCKMIVRSSAICEDSLSSSQAGKFLSVPDVDKDSLENAVESVINSYEDDNENNEILIQPYLSPVSSSGVVLTKYLETGAPYYIFTIDRSSGKTDTVTSGITSNIENHILLRGEKPSDQLLLRLTGIALEIESIMNNESLDIEFAEYDGDIYILQVRPLITKPCRLLLNPKVDKIAEQIQSHMSKQPNICGDFTIFSNMSDWNPAEMIGSAPRPLSLSLYKTLITNNAWAKARKELGYRYVADPLLIDFCGVPYIDVRASLNSMLPANLDNDTADKVIDAELRILEGNHALHDKIEFDVAITCFAFDFNKQIEKFDMRSDEIGFFKHALLDLTDKIILDSGLIQRQIRKFDSLNRRRQNIVNSNTDPITKANRLIHDCIEYGVIPFSILARLAFIASSIIKSLDIVFTKEELGRIKEEIPTVAAKVSLDIAKLRSGIITKDYFIRAYGHLRPDTYNILSPNYAESIDTYLNASEKQKILKNTKPIEIDMARSLFMNKKEAVQKLLEETGFKATCGDLYEFISSAIPARELGKFEFTKNVDAILTEITKYGDSEGISKDELSYIPVWLLTHGVSSLKKEHESTVHLKLPSVISPSVNIKSFKLEDSKPNYITNKRIIAEVIDLSKCDKPEMLNSRIAVIKNADPGYDWIFSYNLAGLVTQFGGAASHMAIRAAEFGLPSAIGCGEALFNEIKNTSRIELDCGNGQIKSCK